MPELKLTEAEIAEAKRLINGDVPSFSHLYAETREYWLAHYLRLALAELEELRAKYRIAIAALSADAPVKSTTQLSVPLILRDRKLPRPQRRKRVNEEGVNP